MYYKFKELLLKKIIELKLPSDMQLIHINKYIHDSIIVKEEKDFSLRLPLKFKVNIKTKKIAIIFHVFYVDVLQEMMKYIDNIPCRADLYISTDSLNKKESIIEMLSCYKNGEVYVKVFENRGRDIAPMLLAFKDVYLNYEICLHLHTKKSLHANSLLAGWRKFICQNLLGNKEIVSSIIFLLERGDIGAIISQHYPNIIPSLNWGFDFEIADKLAKKIGIVIPSLPYLDFPAGSMFWFRSQAILKIIRAGIDVNDFPRENQAIDGTLAHAVERLFLYVVEYSGFKWFKISSDESEISNLPHFTCKTSNELDAFIHNNFKSTLKKYI